VGVSEDEPFADKLRQTVWERDDLYFTVQCEKLRIECELSAKAGETSFSAPPVEGALTRRLSGVLWRTGRKTRRGIT